MGMSISPALREVGAGLRGLLGKRLADVGLVDLDVRAGDVAEELADHILVARFLEVGTDDVPGISLGLDRRQMHEVRRPMAKQLVAASHDPETHLLVRGELRLEGALAVVEDGHNGLPVGHGREIGRSGARRNVGPFVIASGAKQSRRHRWTAAQLRRSQ
jgi:hypothetical protein